MTDEINHELQTGDKVNDTYGNTFAIEVHEDGSATFVNVEDGGEETFTHEETWRGLVEGTIERIDGKSHELVKHY